MNELSPHHAHLHSGPTAVLAGFLAGLRLDEVDDFARNAARRHLIDTLGAVIAGAGRTLGREPRVGHAPGARLDENGSARMLFDLKGPLP